MISPGIVVHTFNSSIKEAEAGRMRVQGQPELHREVQSQIIIIISNSAFRSLCMHLHSCPSIKKLKLEIINHYSFGLC
jgi:hypothetical protein